MSQMQMIVDMHQTTVVQCRAACESMTENLSAAEAHLEAAGPNVFRLDNTCISRSMVARMPF